ncbi:MAG: Wzz/FepE/Etk N-terminal domain-containing protein [Lachnospiraceae bacterium]|nr:Wzz/FepE/Etk N-terminal domain-containing protein [Lachnospiraceae bacterium]
MKKQQDVIEIDLGKLLLALWHRLWIIVLAILVCGGAALVGTIQFIAPTYEANILVYVNNSVTSTSGIRSALSSADLSASQGLVDTYIVILKSRTNLEAVIEASGVDYTYSELYDMIEADAVNSTEGFQIVVTSTVPEEAELIANTIAQILPDNIGSIIEGSSARIVDYAVLPSSKASPSLSRNTMIGGLLGAFISCAIIVLIELLDDVVRDEDELTDMYGYPLLAAIPDLVPGRRRGGYYGRYGYGNYGKTQEGDQKNAG